MSTPQVSACRYHGSRVRGSDYNNASPLSQGRFGRMFRSLPAAKFGPDALDDLATEMVADFEATQTPEDQVDDEENNGISAGYTYFGQCIDHDLTFDPASSLEKHNDPNALVDYRTPRFDLDSVYGRGPDDQPYLYRADGMHLAQGRVLTGNGDPLARDLPRNNPAAGEPARALIGDPRNDENVIVSQLQGMMIRFHNRVVDLTPGGDPSQRFLKVQRIVRWHYQWAVLNDFLPTILGQDTVFDILPHLKNGTSIHKDKPDLRFFNWNCDPFMPIEFSAGAYRFGHSMVRPIYRLNQGIPRFITFSDDPNTSLTGFREFPEQWAIEWNLFFKMQDSPPLGPLRVQPSYKIDTLLVNPLGSLPASIATNPSSLALRNLLRGASMGLPSGQAVAKHMHFPVIPDEKLTVGKANEDGMGTATTKGTNAPLTDVSKSFTGNAPLWYYMLAEAQQAFKDNSTPIRLGPVGGRIVAEVIIGLMLGDSHSFLKQDPSWTPRPDFAGPGGVFGMAELLTQAKLA